MRNTVRTIKDIISEIPTTTADKIKARDNMRKTNPNNPEITTINNEISNEIRDHRNNKWKEFISSINRRTESSKIFKIIKKLNGGKPEANPNQGIKFKDKTLTKPKQIANAFNKQFGSVKQHKTSALSRLIKKQLLKHSLEDAPTITVADTKKAIKDSKASKALGPDKIATVHLKHLGKAGIKYLTSIFNLSLTTCSIPDRWKKSIIVPLLKPGKDPKEAKSYRPVSLLCPAVKIMERTLLPYLETHLTVPNHQHGFRKFHSTATALHKINQTITKGFNKPQPPDRTLLLQIDLSKAFDMVDHDKLLLDIHHSSLPGALKRWLGCYLHGRQWRYNMLCKTSETWSTTRGCHFTLTI